MPRAVSALYKEEAGSTSSVEPVYLLEITHPQLATPVRLVNDTQDLYKDNYLSLPGTTGNYASTPDSVALDITGDLTLVVGAALDSWSGADSNGLIDKMAGHTGAYRLLVTADVFRFDWVDSGSVFRTMASAAHGLTAGTKKYVKFTIDVDDGASQRVGRFYLSDDKISWTQLGSDVTQAGATDIKTNADILSLGRRDGGEHASGAGKYYYAEVRNGIDGPVVATFDASVFAPGALTAEAVTGEIWTVNQSGSPAAQIVAGTQFFACGFRIKMPEDLAKVIPQVPISIDNVGKEMTQFLEQSFGGRGAQVKIMQVMRDTPNTIEQEYNLTLIRVKQDMLEISGQLSYENFLDIGCLGVLYTPETAPGLY